MVWSPASKEVATRTSLDTACKLLTTVPACTQPEAAVGREGWCSTVKLALVRLNLCVRKGYPVVKAGFVWVCVEWPAQALGGLRVYLGHGTLMGPRGGGVVHADSSALAQASMI